jgi:hypothetical protein
VTGRDPHALGSFMGEQITVAVADEHPKVRRAG